MSEGRGPSSPAGPMTGPLQGIRVIDSAEVWAGPMGTSVMADLGAHVVKVESFPRAPQTRPVVPPTARYGFAANEPDPPRPWDRAATHNMANRNKHGIALNARDPDGLRLFQRLASISDVLVDGYAAGVMQRMGMGYDLLSRLNPGLIMVSMAGWGSSGPYSGYVSLGSTIDAMVGHHYLRTYPDADPSQSPACVHSDAIGAMTLVFAVFTALFQRQRTGLGQWVDLSQAEAFLPHMAYPLLDYLMNGRAAEPLGNRDRTMAPHGCYPCRGQDAWIVLCVENEEQWRALCSSAGHPEWTASPRFANLSTRYAHQDELDRLIGEWTAPQDKHALAERLAEAGIPAAPVLKELEVLADEHLAARGFFQELDHKVIGPRRYPGLLWRQTGVEATIRSGPSALGQHNRVVLEEYLGCAPEEYEALEARGVFGDVYPRDAGLDRPDRR